MVLNNLIIAAALQLASPSIYQKHERFISLANTISIYNEEYRELSSGLELSIGLRQTQLIYTFNLEPYMTYLGENGIAMDFNVGCEPGNTRYYVGIGYDVVYNRDSAMLETHAGLRHNFWNFLDGKIGMFSGMELAATHIDGINKFQPGIKMQLLFGLITDYSLGETNDE